MAPNRSRPRYANPPLIEALIEFQFAPSDRPWDSVYLGEIRADFRDEYPEVENLSGASVEIGPGGASFQSAPEMKRFTRSDRGKVITVGPDLTGFSILPPQLGGYPGWETLLEEALRVLNAYVRVAAPAGLRQIGVRYINVIHTASESRFTALLHQGSPLLPPALTRETQPFSYRYEHVVAEVQGGVHREVIQVAKVPDAVAPASMLVVDFDQVWVAGSELRPDVEEVCNVLHDKGVALFNSLFPKKMKAFFAPEDE